MTIAVSVTQDSQPTPIIEPGANPVDQWSMTIDRWVAAGTIVLIWATWRLWLGDRTTVPMIPRLEILRGSPAVSDGFRIVTVVAWLVALLAALLIRRTARRRVAWAAVAIASGTLMMADELMTQPWVYLTCIDAVLLATLGTHRRSGATTWMRWVTISLYAYSAAGKFDFQFAHTTGSELLSALTWGHSDAWATGTVAATTMVLPTFELGVAALFACGKPKWIPAVAATLLHGGLIATLGPWSLGHSMGVLVWNAVMIGRAWLLIRSQSCSASARIRNAYDAPTTSCSKTHPAVRVIGIGVAVVVLVMPTTERWGVWDHWPSWSVYAPHTSRVVVRLPQPIAEQVAIDRPAWQFVRSTSGNDADALTMVRMDLSATVLNELAVPIYPQSDYQLSLLRRWAESEPRLATATVETLGIADRWRGDRTRRRVDITSRRR